MIGILLQPDEARGYASDARFVSFNGRDFHQILKTKFGLEDR